LSFIERRLQWAREKGALALAIRECQALSTIPRKLALAEIFDGRRTSVFPMRDRLALLADIVAGHAR
jgi:hypothetical protein